MTSMLLVPRFKIGQQILVKHESVRRGRSKKLEAPYVGPYEIVKIEGPNLLLRMKHSKTMKIHANRAKPFLLNCRCGRYLRGPYYA